MNSTKTQRLFRVVSNSLYRIDNKSSYERTVEAVCKLAMSVAEDDNTDWYLGEGTEATLDSILVGSFWFFTDYHGGQSSPEYIAYSAISQIFKPGMSSLEEDTTEADVYESWVAKFNENRADQHIQRGA